MLSDVTEPGYLKLSVQGALLGSVTSNLAAVHAELKGTMIVVSVYFFDDPSENERDLIDSAATEVIADFTEGYSIETHYYRAANLVFDKPGWCFLRAEAQSQERTTS